MSAGQQKPMTMQATRMFRAQDWTPRLRAACDRYEAAADSLVNAATAEEADAARAIYRPAREAFEAAMFAHIKAQTMGATANGNK